MTPMYRRMFHHIFSKLAALKAGLASHLASQVDIAKTEEGEVRSEKIYSRLEPYAYVAKIYAQIFTGFVITILLAFKFFMFARECPSNDWGSAVICKNTLALVGDGLMYSAGFELAYMLFTPGPDEAIEPVILGMAATILIVISDEKTNYFDALIPLSLVISIWILFYLSKKFLPEHSKPKKCSNEIAGADYTHRRPTPRD